MTLDKMAYDEQQARLCEWDERMQREDRRHVTADELERQSEEWFRRRLYEQFDWVI